MKRICQQLLFFSLSLLFFLPAQAVLDKHTFDNSDAVLVVDQTGKPVFQWQASKALIPASLTKLVTAHLAIEKWGLDYRFTTDFYKTEDSLWVLGSGDPYLVSEELDRIVGALKKQGVDASTVSAIRIDNHYFATEVVPGRSAVLDPYNAPLSAVAANFNTVILEKKNGQFISAESQTPLTDTALGLANTSNANFAGGAERINLLTVDNAQQHFAELLAAKLSLPAATIHINQSLPAKATPLYRHINTHDMGALLRGALKYSNNFIANQLYLNLAQAKNVEQLSFADATSYARSKLQQQFGWSQVSLEEGAGLSRKNRLQADQLTQVLLQLEPNKQLLNSVDVRQPGVEVYAKTGTLNGVRSYAGYISLAQQSYTFVFMFNRKVAFGYRDLVLRDLVKDLQQMP